MILQRYAPRLPLLEVMFSRLKSGPSGSSKIRQLNTKLSLVIAGTKPAGWKKYLFLQLLILLTIKHFSFKWIVKTERVKI